MSKFIELQDRDGDKCLLSCDNIVAICKNDDNCFSVYMRDGNRLDGAFSYEQMKKLLGVESDGKS